MAKFITAKPSTKTILMLAGVVIISSASAGVTYYLVKGGNGSNSNYMPPETPTEPTKLDEKLPDGTISPAEFMDKINEYYGKETSPKIRGLLISLGDDKFMLADQQGKGGRGVNLDFKDTNINPEPYISAYAGNDRRTPSQTGPVTVTVKPTETSPSSGFKVTSIDR